MTAAELREAMTTLNVGTAELARRLVRHPSTISGWRQGHAPIPAVVARQITEWVDGRKLVDVWEALSPAQRRELLSGDDADLPQVR
jgi:hypothetical protein